ncbi:DUF4435 domain-containing protein [Limnothrix redekei]|uniref:DUF4435 domain-containing protein n=1 Tax=Limnothrix redekei LRLZ20PSL1 TaxID=3112953 RepID=A0ABW7CB70_9CYAN
MRDHISVNREANAIHMRRSTFSGAFLLIEGNSDRTFYERFIDDKECQIVVTSGKSRAISILKILEGFSFQGVVAIVDADFDRLENFVSTSPNLIQTDTHDLETMLLISPALEKVIREFGIRSDDESSRQKMTDFSNTIRTKLLDCGIPIGYLRWISLQESLDLTFDGIEFARFIDGKTLQICLRNLIREVKNKSQAHLLQTEDLQTEIENQRDDSHDPWQVCCGHDLVQILSLGLRQLASKKNKSEVKPDDLERSLRLAYEGVFFYQTQLYTKICLWESNNPTFRVLHNSSA